MKDHTIFGLHAVLAHLVGGYVKQVYLQQGRDDSRIQEIIALAKQGGVVYEVVPKSVLDKQFPGVIHQGVIAESTGMAMLNERDLMAMLGTLEADPLLLVLDQVQDPHNLGACLRTALAAGVHGVIIPSDRSVGLTPVVAKVACGAVGQVPLFRVTNLTRTLEALKKLNIWLYGAAEQGDGDIYAQQLTGPLAWVMGAEGQGLRRLTRDTCDVICRIPTASAFSSLNVSVATGVCLFETMRQRLG